jgi:hypothetical protein
MRKRNTIASKSKRVTGFTKQVDEIVNLLTDKWKANEPICFYDVEAPYRNRHKHWKGSWPRAELIAICKALYRSGAFDPDFWDQFLSCAPLQALNIVVK